MLHHHTFGDPQGRPIIALHGVSGHGARWRRLAERHTHGFRWIGLDLRGHGRSTWNPPWTLERHAADVLDTMDGLGLSTVDLVGHSFGGAVALTAADRAPERFRRLVLLDPGVALDPSYVLRRATAELTPPTYADPEEARLDRAARWPDAADPDMAADEVADHLEQTEDGRYRFRWAAPAVVTAFSEMTREPPLPPPGLPTLLVVAGRGSAVGQPFLDALTEDALTDDALTEDALSRDVGVTEVDGGHTVYVDRPAEVGALIQEFLDDDR